jgi:hypothetical protein
MGNQYLVVVEHDYLLGGRIAQLSGRNEQPTPLATLAGQRTALVQLAEALTGGQLESNAAITALSTVDTAAPLSMNVPSNSKYTVLEAIGGLILDEADVDPAELMTVAGLEVVPNQDAQKPRELSRGLGRRRDGFQRPSRIVFRRRIDAECEA